MLAVVIVVEMNVVIGVAVLIAVIRMIELVVVTDVIMKGCNDCDGSCDLDRSGLVLAGMVGVLATTAAASVFAIVREDGARLSSVCRISSGCR